jgi:hypothetical protein
MIATDLDRTLIYSMAAIESVQTGTSIPPLLCVEMLDGQPLSYMTEAAGRWLAEIADNAVLVPTTTRTLAQYERVRLPGGPAPFAVISNGGHIIVDGVVDRQWRIGVEARIADDGAPLAEIVAGLDRRADGGWVLNRKIADNLFCYLVVDLPALPAGFLDSWTVWCAARGWVVSMQGRKIYALPRGLTKEEAIGEVRDRVGADRILAAGDGALDAGFLSLADAAIRPPHGELAEMDWQSDNLDVATATGVLAGEEMLRWLMARILAGGSTTTVVG